jgi:DNA-binding NarL/FixJ family response regulator
MNSLVGEPIDIIIADDHELFRDGLKLTLSKVKEFNLLFEAKDGVELLEALKTCKPQIVITDIKMPKMDGIEATKEISEKYPSIGIIALSMFDENDLVMEILEAGAKGYLVKNSSKNIIIEAIKSVAKGNPYFCSDINEKLANRIITSNFNPYTKKQKIEFTEKEIELIKLICQQLTNKQIGDKIGLSDRTVEGYTYKVQEKMQVTSKVGLVIYAIKNGIVTI